MPELSKLEYVSLELLKAWLISGRGRKKTPKISTSVETSVFRARKLIEECVAPRKINCNISHACIHGEIGWVCSDCLGQDKYIQTEENKKL